ncbi:MAG: hypothetical protein RDU24_08905 [Humidesulfovibrio sp.]|uniref:hypothetical protein n=1 Tax=Humidesulfovibrio sp. TaxID=2910988 RepID=UPI0027F517A0|nr:hypothetical protein [Humidesulfovibrio sp.]MDQ7835487.1 hypothetical protein [Humidesulfovibrio sp.]
MRSREKDHENRVVLALSWGLIVLMVVALALFAAFIDERGKRYEQRRKMEKAAFVAPVADQGAEPVGKEDRP